MMVVTVEMWDSGYRERRKELAQLAVWNISNLAATSNYRYALFDAEIRFRITEPPFEFDEVFPEIDDVAEKMELAVGSIVALGTVRNHRRANGWEPLIRDVLDDAARQRIAHIDAVNNWAGSD